MAPTRRVVNTLNDPVSLQPLTAEDVTNDLTLHSPVTSSTGASSTANQSNPTIGGSGSGSVSGSSGNNSNITNKHDNASNTTTNNNNNSNNVSIEQIYQSSKQIARENHWRNNPYAAGLVEPTWREEIHRGDPDHENNEDGGHGGNGIIGANGPNRQCCSDVAEPEFDPTCGCLIFSGYVCGMINAGRLGNMAVLKERHVMVDEVVVVENCNDDDDSNNHGNGNNFENHDEHGDTNDIEEGGTPTTAAAATSNNNPKTITRKVSKRQIDLIVGPYWPMMIFVTYPLILAVSTWTALVAIFVPNYNIALVLVWSAMTFGLCFSLFNVAFRDPGILPKYKEIPPSSSSSFKRKQSYNSRQYWRWIESAQSYAPRGAIYDPDCAVIVEEFDHTCPWTGTAIGKKNMFAFQCFIGFLFSCLILDIILLTSSSISIP